MKWIKNLFSKLKSSKRNRMVLIIVLAVVIAVAGFSIFRSRALKVSNSDSGQRTATAENGDLAITLSGSGAVAAGQRKDLLSQVAGTVSENNLAEGKTVKAGDVLIKFQSQDADVNIQKLENSLRQKELAANDQQAQLDSLNVKSPISGRINGLTLKTGDNVNKGQVLFTIADESMLELRAQFTGVSPAQLKNSQKIQVNIPSFNVTLDAKVESLIQSGTDTEGYPDNHILGRGLGNKKPTFSNSENFSAHNIRRAVLSS